MVAIQIPVAYQRSKWISVPREISIPRPMIEKRVITKTVPKVIQVEEQYEVEVGMTEMQAFFLGADADGSGDDAMLIPRLPCTILLFRDSCDIVAESCEGVFGAKTM